MNSFIKHGNCPKCGSSDAYAEYTDGHYWCFSCRHYVPSKINSISQVENYLNKTKETKFGELPYDTTAEIPKEPYAWLKSYSLTSEEISSNNIGWSNSKSMLIIPYYGEENDVLCWQGRFFPARNPKVFTSGYPDSHIILHNNDSGEYARRVVVVEDAISAIKVSRVVNCSELLGANLSMHKAIRLSRLFKHLTLWLDADKLSAMVKFVERYKILFDTVDYIYTDKDPKEYNTEQIKEYLK